MNFADNPERIIEKLNITTKTKTDERILNDAYAVYDKSRRRKSPSADTGFWYGPKRNRIIKYVAAAAVIIVVFAVFFSRDTTKALTPVQIYDFLAEAGDFCVSSYQPDSKEPYRQVWASKNMGIKLFRSTENDKTRFTLWDISRQTKMISFLATNSIQAEPVTDQMLVGLEESIVQILNPAQLTDTDEIPEGAKWTRINDPAVTGQVAGTKVYALTWNQEKPAGEVLYRKWLIFLAVKTNLPARAEFYVKSDPGEQYKLENYIVFTYPQQNEIRLLIRKNFGPAISDPGYMSTPGYR